MASHLRRLRRRLVARAIVRAFVWLLPGLVLVAATALALLDVMPLAALQRGAIVVAGLATLTALLLASATAWRLRRPRETARGVALSAGAGSPSGLVECAELLGSDDSGLAAAHARALADQLDRANLGGLVALGGPARRALIALALVGAAVGLTLAEPRLHQRALRLLGGDGGPSAGLAMAADIEREALVGDIHYVLTLPAYADQPARRIRNSDGDVTALTGTRVQLETRALFDAAAAAVLIDGDEQPVRLEVGADGRTLRGEFTLHRSGSFRFQLASLDQGLIVERQRHSLTAEPDRPPTIDLVEPAQDLELEELRPVALVYQARDDYGLTRVDLLVRKVPAGDRLAGRAVPAAEPAGPGGVAGSAASPTPRPSAAPAQGGAMAAAHAVADGAEPNRDALRPTRKRAALLAGQPSHLGTLTVDPAEYDLVAGEVLLVWLEVRDGNTIATRPGVGQSRELRLQLHSPEERHTENVKSERALLDTMVDLIADRLESPLYVSRHPLGRGLPAPRFDAVVSAQSAVLRRSNGLLDLLEAVENGLSADPLAAGADGEAIRDMRRRHSATYDQESRAVANALQLSDDADRPPLLEGLATANERCIQELESDIPWLERLLSEEAERGVREEAKRLVNAQTALRDLLQKAAESKDPGELRAELLRRLVEMKATLDAMRSRMAESARPMPFENANMDAVTGNREVGDVGDSLDALMELVRQGRFEDAVASLEQLGQSLQGLNSMMDEVMDGGAMPSKAGSLALRSLGNKVDKLRGQQAALKSDTANQAEEGTDKNAEAEPAGPAASDAQANRARDRAGSTGSPAAAAAARPPEAAADSPPGASSSPNKAPTANEAGSNGPATGPDQGFGGREAKGPAADAAGSPAGATPNKAGDDSQGRNARLGAQQAALRERLKGLHQELEDVEARRPGSQAPVKPSLDAAERAMRSAEAALKKGTPGEASGAMEQAEGALQSAGDVIRRETEGRDGASQSPGSQVSRRPVEIPSADRYRVPREFREELLRSHKETAPPSYRSLVERYYEALIQ